MFVKLTSHNAPVWIRAEAITAIRPGADAKDTLIQFGSHENYYYVKESPAEVLALLAGEGKADGIWDVVKKLRFVRDDAALRKAAAAATEITLVMRFDQLDRLVAYFDGRKTDA